MSILLWKEHTMVSWKGRHPVISDRTQVRGCRRRREGCMSDLDKQTRQPGCSLLIIQHMLDTSATIAESFPSA